MAAIAQTPEPPYYAVIFTSQRTEGDQGYAEVAARMVELAATQPGFLGIETAGRDVAITVSYWADLASIKRWRADLDHREARRLGHERWYSSFHVRVARVERAYGI